jgi:hypothetical protein
MSVIPATQEVEIGRWRLGHLLVASVNDKVQSLELGLFYH